MTIGPDERAGAAAGGVGAEEGGDDEGDDGESIGCIPGVTGAALPRRSGDCTLMR
jgi:hypothetical protein